MEKGFSVNSTYYHGGLSRRILIACTISALCVASVPSLAWAKPSSQELSQTRKGLQIELAEAQEHLDQLEGEMGETQQELDKCEEKFEETCAKAEETQAQVDETERQLAEKRKTLGINMRGNYKIGLSSTVDFLLGATSFEDLAGRIYYLDKIGEARAAEIQEVNRLAEELAIRQKKLKKVQSRLQKNAETFEAKLIECREMYYEAEEYRDSLSADVQKALAEEEAARKAEEEAAKKAEEEAARKAEEEKAKKAEEEAARKAEEEKAKKAEEEARKEEALEDVEDSDDDKDTKTEDTPEPQQGPTVTYTHRASPGDDDRLIYIQWGARQQACWPVKGGSKSMKIECGSVCLVLATILLTGDYSITPDSMLADCEAKYGTVDPSRTFWRFLDYMEKKYGIHHNNVGHLSARQSKAILAAGHVIAVGGGCEGRDGLPFCKAPGVLPRCTYGHVVLFYKYADGIFWAKDSSGIDGSAMCAYPDGPLTITHRGLDGRCSHNGQTASYDNYADAFLRSSYNVELWI